MKTVLLTLLILFISQGAYAQVFTVDSKGIVKCPTAKVGDIGTVSGGTYEAVDRNLLIQRRDQGADLTKVCTSLVTNMSAMFRDKNFNQAIGNWDVSNVIDMNHMFFNSVFNQPIDNWDVSKVKNMANLFDNSSFNQHIGSWNVGQVESMYVMFGTSSFNHPIGEWDVSNVKNMGGMFYNSKFNQPIGMWNVRNVTNMNGMFHESRFNYDIQQWDVSRVINMVAMFERSQFNQPLGEWNVSSVRNMAGMFRSSKFNHPIGEWNVSSVSDMGFMFDGSDFNQPIGNWNVSKVTSMVAMFAATKFNHPIGDWDVSKVTNMVYMFLNSSFDHPIGKWNVSQVNDMSWMFRSSKFNQNIESWEVSKVTKMDAMFYLSNYNMPLNNWDVRNVTNMNEMFRSSKFNQPINNWCVINIKNEPASFAVSSLLTQQNKPVWGTCPGLPEAVSLGTPQNNIIDVSPKPTFLWASATNATSYQLQVIEGINTVVLDTLIQKTVLTLTKPLKAGTVHNWRVRGINDSRKFTGEWTLTWKFTTVIIPTPSLLAPSNGSAGLSGNVALSWNPTPNTFDYSVQVSTTNSFTSLKVDSYVGTTTYTLGAFLPGDPASFYWRVRSNSYFGPGAWSPTWTFTRAKLTSTGDEAEVPVEFSLSQNFPNPFNPTTQISFTLPRSASVRLEVFNSLGQPVSVIADGLLPAGAHTYAFDGAALSSGVYLYRLTTPEFVLTRVMVLIK